MTTNPSTDFVQWRDLSYQYICSYRRFVRYQREKEADDAEREAVEAHDSRPQRDAAPAGVGELPKALGMGM